MNGVGVSREGSIVSFYSFKGGVGRTMALANIAFLAARMGKRVLVMDWDLEAPGLSYYFRCLQDGVEARSLKDAPGVLDLLWQWSSAAEAVSTNDEFDALRQKFASGDAFQECVHSLIPNAYREREGTLDFIGAGAKLIAACDMSYEDALSQFSWPKFFDKHVGGVMLNALRQWAKKEYDFVFLDSRTGLADVAGICTMQLPDTVALCFILNRQNIDGIAKVSRAIRTKRDEAIVLRALPLRLAARDSSEASDAQARAIFELSRTGGFSRDAARDDLKTLAVKASESVPYYETLVPFLTDNPTTDPLTQNFAQTASSLLNIEIVASALDPSWVDLARSRLQPKLATIEYVTRLRVSEPTRLVEELIRLIGNASDAFFEGNQPDPDYVRALIAGVDEAESVDPSRSAEMYIELIDLIRALSATDPLSWRNLLAETLERFLDTNRYLMDSDEVITLFEELDLLLFSDPTTEGQLRRIRLKREFASACLEFNQADTCAVACREILNLANTLKISPVKLAGDQSQSIIAAELDSYLLLSYVAEKDRSSDAVELNYAMALSIANELNFTSSSVEVRRLTSQLYSKLALSERGSNYGRPADFAIESMLWSSTPTARANRFQTLAPVVLRESSLSIVQKFCQAFVADKDARSLASIANYLSRTPSISTNFLHTVTSICLLFDGDRESCDYLLVNNLFLVTELVAQSSLRRIALAEQHDSNSLVGLKILLEEVYEVFNRLGFGKDEIFKNLPKTIRVRPAPKEGR